jgi:secreted trypsin-like serine protease
VTSWQKVISNRSHLECIRKKKVRLTTHYRGCEQSHLTYRIDDSPFSNGVCAGESGGPLVFERVDDNVRYVLGGIVTWMKDCGTARETGVFTNISTHLDWIKQTCSSS